MRITNCKAINTNLIIEQCFFLCNILKLGIPVFKTSVSNINRPGMVVVHKISLLL